MNNLGAGIATLGIWGASAAIIIALASHTNTEDGAFICLIGGCATLVAALISTTVIWYKA